MGCWRRAGRAAWQSAVALGAAGVAGEAAADGWPEVVRPLPADWRGEGGSLAILPAACWWLITLAWVRTVDWVHRDATKHSLGPAFWSTVCGLPLPVAALLAWWIPSALAGLAVMLLAWLVPMIVYAVLRNRKVAAGEQILTVGHARRIVAGLLAPLGIEISEPLREEDVLPTVDLAAAGGRDEAENEARLAAARALPGSEELRQQALAAIMARAATVVFDVATDTTVRYEVDGVWGKPKVRQPPRNRREKEAWVEVPPTSRDVGEAVAAAMLALCGLPPTAAKAAGRFAIRVDGKPRNARLTVRSQGAARQLVVQIESSDATFKKPADLGMPEPITGQLGQLLSAERGLLLLSSPPGEGLTTTTDLVVESADRLLRDFISVEDAARPPREIQNVKPVRFDARTGVTPLAALADAMREYPSAIVARDVRDKDLVVELVRLAGEGKLVIMSLKGSDAIEAVTRVLACGVDARQLAGTLLGSLSQRLVRRLCPKCREETPPPPQLLAWLKLTPEQLPHIYKASEQGCRLCQGAGFLGRTGIFELASGGGLRRAIAAGGKPEQLRQAAAQEGLVPLRDASVQLVVAGTTSREEVHRALTGSSASPPAPTAAAGPAAAASGRGPGVRPPASPPARRKGP
jgi:hypothetical protein